MCHKGTLSSTMKLVYYYKLTRLFNLSPDNQLLLNFHLLRPIHSSPSVRFHRLIHFPACLCLIKGTLREIVVQRNILLFKFVEIFVLSLLMKCNAQCNSDMAKCFQHLIGSHSQGHKMGQVKLDLDFQILFIWSSDLSTDLLMETQLQASIRTPDFVLVS